MQYSYFVLGIAARLPCVPCGFPVVRSTYALRYIAAVTRVLVLVLGICGETMPLLRAALEIPTSTYRKAGQGLAPLAARIVSLAARSLAIMLTFYGYQLSRQQLLVPTSTRYSVLGHHWYLLKHSEVTLLACTRTPLPRLGW